MIKCERMAVAGSAGKTLCLPPMSPREVIYMEGTGYRSPARSSYSKNAAERSVPVKAHAHPRTDGGGDNDTAFVETVLTQCIISGVVLLLILLMCLVKTDFTREIRTSLKTALSKNSDFLSAESIASVFNFSFSTQEESLDENIPDENNPAMEPENSSAPVKLSGKTDAAGKTAAEGMISDVPAQTPAGTVSDVPAQTPAGTVSEMPAQTPAGTNLTGDAVPSAENHGLTNEMRIDEDILEEINSRSAN
ncbi:MAG: hypothetical protein LBS21_01900 [Clostridiales bacterium]|nr:hypothetical protein [Clostridiales bacterium]